MHTTKTTSWSSLKKSFWQLQKLWEIIKIEFWMFKSCSQPKLKYIKSANNNLSKTSFQLFNLSLLEIFIQQSITQNLKQFHYFFFWILKECLCELRRTNNPNPIKIKIPACLIHNKVNSPSTDVTQGYDSIQNCLKSNFLFFCLQLLTHHHPSCYPYQFLFIKFLIIKFLLINFLLIMFICFSIGLAEKSKKKLKTSI